MARHNKAIIEEGRVAPLRPRPGSGWRQVSNPNFPPPLGAFFTQGRKQVASTVELIEGDGMSYHISVSLMPAIVGGRCQRAPEGVRRRVFADFGLDGHGFEEDNHAHPDAIVRNFWLQCAPDKRAVCPCKDEETPTVQRFGGDDESGGEYVYRPDNG